jgi:CHAD domain-containing protein
MRIKTPGVRPIKHLQEQSNVVKVAFAACAANPTSGSVHRLRTSIRRIEAQMELLHHLQDLPRYQHASKKLHPYLKRVCKAAGKVRDLDIQLELLVANSTTMAPDDARRLRRRLRRQRENEAIGLRRLLQRLQRKVYSALNRLNDDLRSAVHFSISVAQLVAIAEAWFVRSRRPTDTVEHLHATRKAAKLARYMAETARGSKTAAKLAKRFEAIQRAGGQWHDWMQLAAFATNKFGKRNPLAESFKSHCDLSLRMYQTKVADRRRGLSSGVTSVRLGKSDVRMSCAGERRSR